MNIQDLKGKTITINDVTFDDDRVFILGESQTHKYDISIDLDSTYDRCDNYSTYYLSYDISEYEKEIE